jgi:hypothetical protein
VMRIRMAAMARCVRCTSVRGNYKLRVLKHWGASANRWRRLTWHGHPGRVPLQGRDALATPGFCCARVGSVGMAAMLRMRRGTAGRHHIGASRKRNGHGDVRAL